MGDRDIVTLANEILETIERENNEVTKTHNGFVQRIKAKDFLKRYEK